MQEALANMLEANEDTARLVGPNLMTMEQLGQGFERFRAVLQDSAKRRKDRFDIETAEDFDEDEAEALEVCVPCCKLQMAFDVAPCLSAADTPAANSVPMFVQLWFQRHACSRSKVADWSAPGDNKLEEELLDQVQSCLGAVWKQFGVTYVSNHAPAQQCDTLFCYRVTMSWKKNCWTKCRAV